jgi:hypothetical protein
VRGDGLKEGIHASSRLGGISPVVIIILVVGALLLIVAVLALVEWLRSRRPREEFVPWEEEAQDW